MSSQESWGIQASLKRSLESVWFSYRNPTQVCLFRRQRRSYTIKVRELGKIALCLRMKGCQLREKLVTVTRELRLFNKNIGDCESVTTCIVAESCPVSVSETPFQRKKGLINGVSNRDSLKVAQYLSA